MLTGLVLAALIVAAWMAGRTGRPGAVALAVVSVLWLVVDKSMEGPTLVRISTTHGLVAADLAGVAGLLVAALAWRRGRRP